MILAVNSYGTSLRKRDGCIEVATEDTCQQFLPKQVEALILSAPCSLTSEVISLCAENDIPIMMNDRFGMPIWRTEAVAGGSVPLLRRRQLLLAERPEGSELTRALLTQKLEARIVFLRNLASNRRDERGSKLKEAAEQILEYKRPTLVYDLVEPFRADVEACVSKLFTRRQIRIAEHFQTVDTGPCLSGTGKRILLDTLYQKRKDTKKVSRLVTGLKNGLVQWAA